MMISEAARVSGVSARALRYYEEEGLIAPDRGHNGYRRYCRATIDRIRVVRFLVESGLPMRLIKEVMPHLPVDAVPEVVCPEFLADVRGYRDRLAERIAGLTAQQSALDAFLGAAAAEG
ncbi:MerR family transcriptional regulator [Streptomyces sp. 4.24]|uniref:MerR family transcriptional regulator n=1 Tax=Streptomyces tritrimontium TaxID=3406573 RepID=UPI003BB6C87D